VAVEGNITWRDTHGVSTLFLARFLCRLCHLSRTLVGLGDGLDDTDSDGLPHVANSEAAKWRIFGECFDAHWLRWNHLDNGSITRLDKFRTLLNGLAGTAIDLLEQLRELASNMGGMAIEDGGIASTDLARVVEDNDLGIEAVAAFGRVVLRIASNIATTNLLDGDVLDVEADIVTRDTLNKLLVVHLDRLDFGGHTGRCKGDDHTSLDDTSLDTADGNCADTADFVDILQRETKWFVGRTGWWVNAVNGLEQSLAGALGLGLLLPALVPRAIGRSVDHIVAVEAGDGDEGDGLWVVANLLDEVGRLLDDLVKALLGPFGRVHLVNGNNELLHSESVREQSVLASLAILGDTGLELTGAGGNDENSAVGLGGTSDHVLDEVTVARGVNDGDIVPGSLELPEGNINRDTTLTLGLELVEYPSVLEGAFTQFGGFLLELLDRTLVDTTALVDQVAGGGRLAGVDVADNDDVDMNLLLTHVDGVGLDLFWVWFGWKWTQAFWT